MRTAPAEPAPGLRAVLTHRSGRLYFCGLTCAQLGGNVLILAAGVWVKELTDNDGAAALVMFFVSAPALLSPLAGMVADRYRRRTLMIGTNIVMCAATLCLLAVDGASGVVIIYSVMAVYGLALVMVGAAESGLLATMLPSALLPAANSLIISMQEGVKMVAPGVGALLFTALGAHWLVAAVCVVFGGTVVLFSRLRVDELAHQGAPDEASGGAGVLTGLRKIREVTDLRAIAYTGSAVMFVVGFTQIALFAVVDLGLHRPPAFLGLLVSLQGIGSVMGGILAPRLVARWGERRFVATGIALSAAGNLLLLVPDVAAVVPGMVLRGLGLPWLIVGAYTLLQRSIPVQFLGQAAGTLNLLLFVPQAASLLLSATAGRLVSYTWLLATTVSISAIGAALLLARPRTTPRAVSP